MKKILVTGCCGFIGSHLAEALLSQGYEVHGIDNFDPFYPRTIKEDNLRIINRYEVFKFFETDLRLSDFEKKMDHNNYDVVIHLAGKVGVLPSISQINDYIDSNIIATANLLNYMKKASIKKMIFASSSSVYGNNRSVPFCEKDMVNEPISPYAFTKRSCELLNFNYHHLYDFDIINLRLFTVYGPRQRPDLAIYKFVRNIDLGLPITVYGNGATSRDYTYVSDIVSGFSAALNYILSHNMVFELVNLGNMKPIKLTDLISTIAQVMNKSPAIDVSDIKPGDVTITYADISKARKIFDYDPATNLQDGIRHFVEWYYKNKK
ncbi:MAG: GDP-mannose 4,6-dehydratase [Chitinophagales bacterium]